MEDSRKEFNDLEGGHDAPCDLKVEHSEHEVNLEFIPSDQIVRGC